MAGFRSFVVVLRVCSGLFECTYPYSWSCYKTCREQKCRLRRKMLRTVSMTGNAALGDKSKMGQWVWRGVWLPFFGSSFVIDREMWACCAELSNPQQSLVVKTGIFTRLSFSMNISPSADVWCPLTISAGRAVFGKVKIFQPCYSLGQADPYLVELPSSGFPLYSQRV